MHKSKGNAIWFDEGVEKIGADVMRWLYCVQNPTINLKFGFDVAREARRYVTILWNLGLYVKTYCKNNKFSYGKLALESKWILSRLENVKRNIAVHIENLEHNNAMNEIKTFLIDNLSREYGQYIRSKLDDKDVQGVFYYCFLFVCTSIDTCLVILVTSTRR